MVIFTAYQLVAGYLKPVFFFDYKNMFEENNNLAIKMILINP